MDIYDPTDDVGGQREKALAKQRLRKELGIGPRLGGIGTTPKGRMDSRLRADLARRSARDAVNAESVQEARARADPDGLLTDRDVEAVLEREGITL